MSKRFICSISTKTILAKLLRFIIKVMLKKTTIGNIAIILNTELKKHEMKNKLTGIATIMIYAYNMSNRKSFIHVASTLDRTNPKELELINELMNKAKDEFNGKLIRIRPGAMGEGGYKKC